MKPVKNNIHTQMVGVGQVWKAIPGNGKLVENSYVLVTEIDTEPIGPRLTGQYRIGYEYIRGYDVDGTYHRYLDEFLKSAELTQERR